jgi:hypothetical protein
MARHGAFGLLLSASALLSACAGTPAETPPSLLPEPAPHASDDAPPGAYKLSKMELKYDCKKLTGLMQVRILQIRGYDSRRKASLAARGMQSVVTPIWGGTTEGLDPDAQYRKDRAMLEAYNQQLELKRCRTFDLEAELKGTGADPTPEPKAKAKP